MSKNDSYLVDIHGYIYEYHFSLFCICGSFQNGNVMLINKKGR